jgi:clan AA aspartic protease (TIGR02281 family)
MRVRTIVVAGLLISALLAAVPLRAAEVPLETKLGIYTVPVQINGAVTLNFLIDTGSSSVVIPTNVLERLVRSGTVTENDIIGTGAAVLADRSMYRAVHLRLRELRVGNEVIRDVSATASPALEDPLLGQSFLTRFGSVTFDNRRRVMILSESSPSYLQQPPLGPAFSSGAYGSFAYDQRSGRFGTSSNQPYYQTADQAAIATCASPGCQIVLRTGPRECGAVAASDYGGGWGGGKGPGRDGAILAAVRNCQTSSGVQCRVRAAECNQ